jgi:hypothetical protein
MRDQTQVQPPAELVRRPAPGAYANYRVAPVELEVSERITLVHWPHETGAVHEQTELTRTRGIGLPPVELTAPPDTHPGEAPTGYESGGVCIVVLGAGPNGVYEPPTDVQMLATGDELDVVINESGATTSFRVEQGGLRVDECGTPRGVARRVDGAARLRDGSSFRIGSTWLFFGQVIGREAEGIYGRVCVLAPSGHVITAYPVGEAGLVVGQQLGDPTLSVDPHIVAQHCRVVAGPNGFSLEELADSGGTYLAVDEGDFLGLGCIAVFGDTAVRLDPLAPPA